MPSPSTSWKTWSPRRMLLTLAAAATGVLLLVWLLSGDFQLAWLLGCTAFVAGCIGSRPAGWAGPNP